MRSDTFTVDLEQRHRKKAEPGGVPSPYLRRLFLWGPFALVVVLTGGITSDDPLITLRYAANVVHGLGPVFNAGQRVEGFTSPLHLLVSIGVFLVPGGHALLRPRWRRCCSAHWRCGRPDG